MLTLNIIEILKKLDKKELKRFGDFIRSPYFNSIRKLEDLYDIIAKEYPLFSEVKLDDKKVFKKLYPGKKYKDKTIKNLYSEFGKVLRKFLITEEVFLDQNIIDLKLVKALIKKGDLNASNKIINERIEASKYKDMGKDYFLYISDLEGQKRSNLLNEGKIDLQKIYDTVCSRVGNLIGYFFWNFSNSGYYLLFSQMTININTGNEKLSELIKSFDNKKLLEYLDTSGLQGAAAVKVYYLFLHSMVNDFTEKDYLKLKDVIVKNIDNFTKTDIMHFWMNMIDTILVKLIPLDSKFYREIFDISKFFCKLKIYPDDSFDEFPHSMFRNIIFSGLIIEEYEWTEKFLNEYSSYLEEDKKENEINYNKGLLYFNLKRYNESLTCFSKVSLTDIYQNLILRFYILINHIELKHYDSAASMLNSIKQFHKSRKDIPELIWTMAKTSIRYLGEIIKCEEAGAGINYSIYKEALGPGRCFNKKYILNKMKEMI